MFLGGVGDGSVVAPHDSRDVNKQGTEKKRRKKAIERCGISLFGMPKKDKLHSTT